MKLPRGQDALYLSTTTEVVRIPTSSCSRFLSKQSCLQAMDPYCGWHTEQFKCISTPNHNPRTRNWIQEQLTCPNLDLPVDGNWGQFTDWFTCDLNNPQERSEDGSCMCRKRPCNSPSPKNGGANCPGSSVQVTNCTRHGGWTEWSAWSACSTSCGTGAQTRYRRCGNPSPAFGGNECIGPDYDRQICKNNCSGNDNGNAVQVQQQSSGRWSNWSEWSKCSTSCGRGFSFETQKVRIRSL